MNDSEFTTKNSVTDDAPSPSVIACNNIRKDYRHHTALLNVDLKVPQGKVFALLGENGAGKTTLIRILTGYLTCTSGNASILGMDCSTEAQAIRKKIGYVSDSPALYEWMTPPEIGWFASAFYDNSFLPRYRELLEEFSVPLDTKIKSLSKGQRAKVALALATAHDPDLLILDEPTSGLDPMVRRQFLESMVQRAASGRTVLLSSHQINEVERVADIIAILHEGRLRLVEPLETLKEHTRIVTATMDDAHVEAPEPAGDVLGSNVSGRQRRWVVSHLQPGWEGAFENDPGVKHFDRTMPSLEEIFVAVCESNSSEGISNWEAGL